MTAVVKTLTPARPLGKEVYLISNIPFRDRNDKDAYSTSFQLDFPPKYSKKELLSKPDPAPVEHKDLGHFKEYLTENVVSYQRHQLPKTIPILSRTENQTNVRMQTDPREIHFLTTHSQTFPHHPTQPLPSPFRPQEACKKIQKVEEPIISTAQAAFIPHPSCPSVKIKVKHLEEGFPTLKGDERHNDLNTHYKNTFLGVWNTGPQPVKKHVSSVYLGNPADSMERKTTSATSFSCPTICRQTPVKEPLKLILGKRPKDLWSSTTKDAFCHHKLRDQVVRIKKDPNVSSLPDGDTDVARNKEWMSVTTNKDSFPDVSPTQRPARPALDLITKSHVEFSCPSLSDQFYSTTAKENYNQKNGRRASPVLPLSEISLGESECEPGITTTMADFTRKKGCNKILYQTQQKTNLRFPLGQAHFSTTTGDHYTVKPLSLQPVRKFDRSHTNVILN